MCGIQAIFSKELPNNVQTILKAGEVLKQRGPDCSCTHMNSRGIYTFHRLCINDKTSAGNQPFISGKITLLVNGEIYNHIQLEKVYNLKCQSKSDCEVILKLYEKLGSFSETVKLLDGVFAIVLVDGDDCWFARDRVGVRPLFMGRTEGILSIASVAQALLPFCEDVQQVLPGWIYYYHKESKRCVTTEYLLDSDYVPEIKGEFDSMMPLIHDKLTRAVEKRLMSDRPMGCLLSGGLDSSIITAILCKLLGPKNVRTYSIGMEGSVDLKYARKVADYLGTVHTEVKFTPEEGIAVIPEVIKCLESYDVTTVRASVGMYLISKYISENTDDIVIFSGEGSDELFCGYLYFHNAPTAEDASEESKRLIKELYMYDVLRADRTVSCHGLELRVPFLDMKVLHFSLGLSPEYKAPKDKWEKLLLRKAFETYLPKEVVWRRKNGFSDAISSLEKPWYKYIEAYVDTKLGDELYDEKKYISKEAMYYRFLFDKLFPDYKLEIPMWLPRWSGNIKNPSGMLMKMFDDK